MSRHFRSSLALLSIGAFALSAPAQPHPALSHQVSEKTAQVDLGQSSVPLYGPWKFTVGDSPIDPKTGQPLWSEPGFDDAAWENVDLTPAAGSVDPLTGATGFVPGWTVTGHKDYWGYAWYRIRVHVQALPGEELALAGPADIDDVYQVFADGKLVGEFGNFKGKIPTAYYTQPMMFPLPVPSAGADSGTATMIIAFRVFMLSSTLNEEADVGGFHNAPVLGHAGTVAAEHQMSWLEILRSYASTASEAILFGLMALLAFTMILFDRSDRVYLWMGALFLLETLTFTISAIGSWSQFFSILDVELLTDAILASLIFAGWSIVWWVWFGRQRPAWTPRAAAILAVLYAIAITIGEEMFTELVPHSVSGTFMTASRLLRLLFLALQLWTVFQGIRRQGLEGWLVLPAVLLWGISNFSTEFLLLHVHIRWEIFGFSIRLNQISNLLLAAVVVVLLVRRLLKSIRSQRQMALDVKQAQEVQQMILPEARTTIPGLVIESEYRPAREVGGDFFQVIPHPSDGSLLIVAGDVAGKGLQAGMLVALLVGAIRTAAGFNPDPRFVLAQLNERLLGRNNAQATCLALRICADGSATLANAGHMPPYLNGESMPMDGALPLGMMPQTEFSVMRFRLKDSDKLVLLSDGVVEAMDENGQLFGFERVHELLHSTLSATAVADAAQDFGQEDDISVISVTRTAAVMEPTLA
ncbi:MAG: SpoIIE family protein phosphatase [Terracidiphilus sp.]